MAVPVLILMSPPFVVWCEIVHATLTVCDARRREPDREVRGPRCRCCLRPSTTLLIDSAGPGSSFAILIVAVGLREHRTDRVREVAA